MRANARQELIAISEAEKAERGGWLGERGCGGSPVDEGDYSLLLHQSVLLMQNSSPSESDTLLIIEHENNRFTFYLRRSKSTSRLFPWAQSSLITDNLLSL